MNWKLAMAAAAGGAIGSLARYWLSLLAAPMSGVLPWGTILINVIGSFVIGATAALALNPARAPISETARVFVMVGLCGGFTTFSAFSLQTFELLRVGAGGRAAVNVGLSVAACLAATAAGYWAVGKLSPGP